MIPTDAVQLSSHRKKESLANLPLQIASHLNAYFAPFLFITEISCLILKYPYLSVTYKVILVAVLIVYILVEVVRLFLAIVGNLGEKIPAISGFWILSLVLQMPIVLFLLLNPDTIFVPVEIITLSIHLLFLIIEIPAISGFWILSLVLQMPIVLFLLLNPDTIFVPVEIITLSIHLLFLIIEIIAGFLAIKVISTQQIKLFKMIIDESEK
ncbi:hypothetical protein DICVIV_05074 [Dictyocaulus viviparus]|uniref:Uncharacterized protein n=1 Tax=Dictyocaulus viviparus TaxID=29172 RepID=A0A0D8Y2M5_DICVI|nr:hypothetical protein DICVIV_05074 [Dictyocaulus viviparus]